ncbi:uncharacterized protein TNIN_236451, partial [Trichonephila inaurata madagascariensis]
DYEIRSYAPSTWVTTFEINRLAIVAELKATKTIMEYFGGKNNRSTEIPKTLPMRNRVSRANPHHYEVSYMLPAEFAADPPGPIDLRVTLSREDETLYAVKSFKGFYPEDTGVREKVWDEKAKRLAFALQNDEHVEKVSYFRVQYDTPSLFKESYHEVWMIKRPKKENKY